MKSLQDIKEKINEIRNSNFKVFEFKFFYKGYKAVDLLRNALICINAISMIDNVSNEEKKELYNELDCVMKNKLKELNPNFSEDILNNMIKNYHMGYNIYPIDILVADDAVFRKEGIYDDFGSIYKVKTSMLKNMKPYYDITDVEFILKGYNFLPTEKKEKLTSEEEIYISKFISNSINSIYKKNIIKSLCDLNTDTVFYGYAGFVSGEFHGVNVYMNIKFMDIARSLKSKEERDIKLCVQSDDDIIVYYIHQSFNDREPVWNVVKTIDEVWKLTDEVLKLENKNENNVLIKKRNIDLY